MTEQTFTDGSLTLRLFETPEAICLEWLGQSIARDPAQFLTPILREALERSVSLSRPLVVDFRKLDYLNSATISPVILMLEQAHRGQGRVEVRYRRDLKWQELSFTALGLFQTLDRRIDIRGL